MVSFAILSAFRARSRLDIYHTQADIAEGVCPNGQLFKCRRCQRYCGGATTYVACEPESRELMAICLKRVRGLKRVRVADAAWIWTEPHSMRLKVRLTIQKEVAPGAILQKPLDCEFVVRNQQCTDCRQQFENFAWTAAVQVRQRVSHKRTFFYLEQAILKKNAQAAAVKIEQFRDGLDFFFRQRNDAVRFVQFLKDCVPCRVKETKKLVSAGAISASRCVETPSRHRRDSCPSHDAVGRFDFEFEAIRTASRDRDAPRRSEVELV